MESAVTHHNSELRSVAEPQQWQSELCRCTRLLQQSSLKVANNTIIRHFCACALAGATRLCACKHARSSRFSQQSFLLLLGLAQFHDRKPIFRGALCNNRTLSTLSLSIPHRSRASPPIRVTIAPATQPGTENPGPTYPPESSKSLAQSYLKNHFLQTVNISHSLLPKTFRIH